MFEVMEDMNVIFQEVFFGLVIDCGVELVEEILVIECVGIFLNVGSVFDLILKLLCNKDELYVCEGYVLLDGNYVVIEEDDRVKFVGIDGFYFINFFNGVVLGIVLRELYGYVFQVVKYFEKYKIWK